MQPLSDAQSLSPALVPAGKPAPVAPGDGPVLVACVQYLNTLPLIAGLAKLPAISLLPMVPSAIAGKVVSEEAELGLCSLVDCHRHNLARLPVGMIACDGPTLTVRLWSKVPFARVRTMHADVESHTSVVLAQLLMKRAFGVPSLRVEPYEQTPAGTTKAHQPETLLLIGDKAVLRAPAPGDYPHTLDLGEAWKAMTGLPFVYAMWATTRERATSERVQLASQLLDRQRRHNAGRLAWIMRSGATALGWDESQAMHYVGSLLRFAPDARSEAGLTTFLRMATEDGLLPAPPETSTTSAT
jgi:chorismate dehydratase